MASASLPSAARDQAERLAFVTNVPLERRGRELYSSIASARREILLPAQALEARGFHVDVVSLPHVRRDEALMRLAQADCLVFGKLLMAASESAETAYASDAQAYAGVLASLPPGKRIAFCFADDHFDAPGFNAFYLEVAKRSWAWVASSEALAARLKTQAHCPVHAYPEPTETPRGTPRAPQRGMRERVAAWLARKAGIGLAPWRLRLLWFGHPTNAPSLISVLPELRAFGERVPLRLECMTQPGSALDARRTPPAEAGAAALEIVVTRWSQEGLAQALQACDAVVLPQETGDPRKLAKSNNRLVDALHAGRFVIAHPLPAYQELARFAWVGGSIAEGLRWMLAHRQEAQRRLEAGQAHVARYHSLDALAEFWMKALQLRAMPQE